jgi:hypothetical protein
MRHLCTKQLTNERGATLVLVSVCLVVLLGSAALAIDLGMLYDARNDAQKAADAAALAAGSVFAPGGVAADEAVAEATRRAHEFGGMNRIRGRAVLPSEMLVEVLEDEAKVRVTVTRTDIPLWFARIFGRNTSTVAARAAAAAEFSGSVTCLRPIAFADLWHERVQEPTRFTVAVPGQTTCAWGDGTCDYYDPVETGRGQWWRNVGLPSISGDKGAYEAPAKTDDVGRQWTFDLSRDGFDANSVQRLDKTKYYPLRIPGCSGGNCWRQGLAGQTCTGVISIGDDIVTEPGVQVGPTDQGFGDAYAADPLAYWDDGTNTIRNSRYPLGCSGAACTGEGSPRTFTVAMVHPVSRILPNASGTFPIQNFSAFFLESWVASGQTNQFTVRWMKPKAVQDNCRERGNCRDNLVTLRLVE